MTRSLTTWRRRINLDIIYLEYTKAFDKVDVYILANWLKSKGITGKIGRWNPKTGSKIGANMLLLMENYLHLPE